MELDNLKAAAKQIIMPEEVKYRIAQNCSNRIRQTMEVQTMPKTNFVVRKPAAALMAVAVCLTLALGTMAATGVLQGYFRDITGFTGAIVGTSYEQATDEIKMDVTVNENELTILAAFANPDKAPYCEAEQLSIAQYQIITPNGKIIQEGSLRQSFPVLNGQAAITLELDNIEHGSYKLVVTVFVSEKKADQPLKISGIWESDFTK